MCDLEKMKELNFDLAVFSITKYKSEDISQRMSVQLNCHFSIRII